VAAVRLEDQVPPGTRLLAAQPEPEVRDNRLAWNLGNLEAGGERRIKVEVQSSGEGECTLAPVVTFAAAYGPRVQVVRPPFAVTQAVSEGTRRGESVVFQIRVSNNTAAPIQRVIVRDQLPDGLQHAQGNFIEAEIGTLTPNETKTLRLETQAARSGRFFNEVLATAEGGLESRSRLPVTVAEPALGLRLDVPGQDLVGREMDVRLEASNPTALAANNARLVVMVPDGLDFVMAGEGGRYDASTRAVFWMFGTLPPRKAQTVAMRLRGQGLGEQKLQAVLTADGITGARATSSVRVEGAPALRLEMAYRDASVEVHAEAAYEVRVVNQGSAPSPNVRLVVTLPEGLLPVWAEGPTAHRAQGQQVFFEPLAQMAPRAEAVYRVRARALRPGDYRFRAELVADSLVRPIVAEESTHAYSDAAGSSGTSRGR
jgi:uncharacterized repeat protein (TIGR01451 family)